MGVLYAKLFWLFQKDDTPNPLWNTIPSELMKPAGWHIEDTDFTSSTTPDRPLPMNSEPHRSIRITRVQTFMSFPSTRGTTLRRLAAISHQGEGAISILTIRTSCGF